MKELKSKGGFLTEAGRKAIQKDYKAGLTNKEIQDKYDLSSATVWNHTKNLNYKKRKYVQESKVLLTPEPIAEEKKEDKKKYGKILTLDRMDIFRRLGQGQDVYTIARETGNKLNSIRYFADMYYQGELARKDMQTNGKPFAFGARHILWFILLAGIVVDVFIVVKYLGYL